MDANRRRIKNKTVCLLLTLLLVCSYITVVKGIEHNSPLSSFAGGDGSVSSPYEIRNWTHLNNTRNDLTANYTLINDLTTDMDDYSTFNSGEGWEPIGYFGDDWSEYPFIGTFNGDNYTIDGLYINRDQVDGIGYAGGLFGYTDEATIQNLGVTNVNITNYHDDWGGAGGLVAYTGSVTDTIINCYTTGSIKGNIQVGGLVGYNIGIINKSYVIGNVDGGKRVGGLVGYNIGIINKSYATGSVNGSKQTGGFVGYNCVEHANIGTIENSYSHSNVTRTSGTETSIGGFIGENCQSKILNSYSTGSVTYEGASDPIDKGFAGTVDTGKDYEMTGNFWDNQTSRQSSTSGDATGLNTSEMQSTSTYAGKYVIKWNFLTTWQDNTNDYPTHLETPQSSPFEIRTLAELSSMEFNLSVEYHLMNDIDMSDTSSWNGGNGWLPIGSSSDYFRGKFNGNNYTLSNLYINRTDGNYQGLFGYISPYLSEEYDTVVINNLKMDDVYVSAKDSLGALSGGKDWSIFENVHILSGEIRGRDTIGGLSGGMYADPDVDYIIKCSSNVSVIVDKDLDSIHGYFGGLVSTNYGTIDRCYATGDVYVEGEITATKRYFGGLVGMNYGTIENSYAQGTVNATEDYGESVGGLVGYNSGAIVNNSYSTGNVIGNTYVGGFIGYRWDTNANNNFWDTETSGTTDGVGDGSETDVTGKITPEMKNITTFSSWDISEVTAQWHPNTTTIWNIINTTTYPFFSWDDALIPIMTNSATNITDTSSHTKANLTSLGHITTDINISIRYRPQGTSSWYQTSPQNTTEIGTFTFNLTSLQPSTTYEYKAVMQWNPETEGETKTFTTTSTTTDTDATTNTTKEDIYSAMDILLSFLIFIMLIFILIFLFNVIKKMGGGESGGYN